MGDEIRRITQSELKTFKRCRRKWYLSSVRRLALRREDKANAAALGNRIHAALEAFYTADEEGVQGGIEAARASVETGRQRDLLLVPDQADKINKQADLARIMVEGYAEWAEETGEEEDFELVGVEQAVEVDFPVPNSFDAGVHLMGKMDQRVVQRSTGLRLFRDWKKVDNFSRIQLLALDEQMRHYSLLERLHAPDGERTSGGLYTMLRAVKRTATAKPPFYMREIVTFNDHVLGDYFYRVWREAKEMLAVEFELRYPQPGLTAAQIAYPNPTRDCTWDCPFLPVCHVIDDSSADAEGLIATLYEERDPLERYNAGPAEGNDL